MPRIANVYRRGSIYWYRSNLRMFSRAIDIRFSMRTACGKQARSMGAALSAASWGVRSMLERKISASGWVPDSTLNEIGRQAYDEVLGHLRAKYTAQHEPELLEEVNLAMCDMFALLEVSGGMIELTSDWDEPFRKAGHSQRRLENLRKVLAHYQNGETAIAAGTVANLLEQHGMPVKTENLAVVRQSLLPVFRKAFETAGERLSSSTAPMPDRVGEERPSAHTAPPVATPPVQVTVSSVRPMTITQATEACIGERLKDGLWDQDSCDQVRTAVRMFAFANSDLSISDIGQHHLGAFVDLCYALPRKWNRTTAERLRGFEASLERAKGLDPDDVGLSPKTRTKHLTWIASVIEWAGGKGHGKPVVALDFKTLRKGTKVTIAKNELRLSWTVEELAIIFSASVWTGSAGLFDRLGKGSQVWHDAWYWMTIALLLGGFRSAEFGGCSLDEVKEDDPVPHIHLKPTKFRRLKNLKAARKVPIPPEMIRLGFIDYVKAMRAVGQELLFPELHSPKNKSGFDSTFYKIVFSKLRAHFFPDGTSWFHENGGRKEKDAHSLRGSTSNLLLNKIHIELREDILGHSGESETRKTYDEASELLLKRDALDKLSYLTAHLPVHPLNIRPAEWRGYGQPRGRPVNGGRGIVPKRRA